MFTATWFEEQGQKYECGQLTVNNRHKGWMWGLCFFCGLKNPSPRAIKPSLRFNFNSTAGAKMYWVRGQHGHLGCTEAGASAKGDFRCKERFPKKKQNKKNLIILVWDSWDVWSSSRALSCWQRRMKETLRKIGVYRFFYWHLIDWSFLLSIKRMSQSICAVCRRRGRCCVVLRVAETLRVNTWIQAETDSEWTTEHNDNTACIFRYLLKENTFWPLTQISKSTVTCNWKGSSCKYNLCSLPANFTWNLFSGLRIWTYRGQLGAKSFTAQARRMVWWSWEDGKGKGWMGRCVKNEVR